MAGRVAFERGEIREVITVAVILLTATAVFAPITSRTRGINYRSLCIERIGNLAQAALMYAHDSDDRLPLAFAFDASKAEYRWRTPVAYPAAWSKLRTPDGVAADMAVWANTTLPYSTNDKNYLCPSTELIHLPGVNYMMARPLPAAMSYAYNGLLHQYALASVANKGDVPLLWEGLGSVSLNGFAFSIPSFDCRRESPVWAANGARGEMIRPLRPTDCHREKYTFAYVDGHAGLVSTRDDGIYFGRREDGTPSGWLSTGGFPTRFRPDYGPEMRSDERVERFVPYKRP
jgi:hypothetical protein